MTVRHQPQSPATTCPIRSRPIVFGLVAGGDLVCGQQVSEVVHVLLVELDDLQLGQEEVRDVERVRNAVDPIGEVQDVTHVEPVHDHVDRGLPVRRGEVHLPVAVEGVEALVAEESLFGEERDHVLLLRGDAGEVHVLIVASPVGE